MQVLQPLGTVSGTDSCKTLSAPRPSLISIPGTRNPARLLALLLALVLFSQQTTPHLGRSTSTSTVLSINSAPQEPHIRLPSSNVPMRSVYVEIGFPHASFTTSWVVLSTNRTPPVVASAIILTANGKCTSTTAQT